MGLFSKKETVTLSVKGMHCPKCVAHVTEALQGVEGVTGADVSLEGEKAVVEGHGFSTDACIAAVTAAGFEAALAE
jgi:P-type Cu2+ transporter